MAAAWTQTRTGRASDDLMPAADKRVTVTAHADPDNATLRRLWASPALRPLTPFQSLEFVGAFRDHLAEPEGGRLVVLEASRELTGEPLLLVPFLIRQRGPARVAGFPDRGFSDQNAPIIGNACQDDQVFAAAWEAVISALPEVDLVDIAGIPERIGPVPNPLARLPEAGATSHSLYWMDPTADELRHRHARRQFRRLQKKGNVEVRLASGPKEAEAIYEILVSQRRTRFRSMQRDDALERPEVREFYRQLLRHAGPEGRVWAFALDCNGETIATNIALRYGRHVNFVLLSIGAAEWHTFAPGIVLLERMIRYCAEQGVTNFCFGTGMQSYKARFTSNTVPVRHYLRAETRLGRLYLVARATWHKGHALLPFS